jgi:hypothetical protein
VRQLGLATGWALGASSRPFCWGGGALGMRWPIGGSSTADTSGPLQEWSVDPIGGSEQHGSGWRGGDGLCRIDRHVVVKIA